MRLLDHFRQRTPSGRKQILFATALGSVAFILMARFVFPLFSSGSSGAPHTPQSTQSAASIQTATNTPQATKNSIATSQGGGEKQQDQFLKYESIKFDTNFSVANQGSRDVFSYYVPPPPPPPKPIIPTYIISSVSPQSVYMRSGAVTFNISGDKFTPASYVYLNDQQVSTMFISAQNLTATVPANFTENQGSFQVSVHTIDGKDFSNVMSLQITKPSSPQFKYVGMISNQQTAQGSETAILKDTSDKLMKVKLGDVITGDWKVTSIDKQSVQFVYTNLPITESLPLTLERYYPNQQSFPARSGSGFFPGQTNFPTSFQTPVPTPTPIPTPVATPVSAATPSTRFNVRSQGSQSNQSRATPLPNQPANSDTADPEPRR